MRSSATRAGGTTKTDMSTTINNDLIAINLPWGVLSVRGPDRLSFLHGLGTNAFTTGDVGFTRYTSFLTAHGKLLSYVRCLVTKDDVKIICESTTLNSLLEYINSRIFPFDQVQVLDESGMSSLSALLLFDQQAVNSQSNPEQNKTDEGLLAPDDTRRNDVKYDVEDVEDSGIFVYKLPALTEMGNLRGQRPPLASLLCLMQSTTCNSKIDNDRNDGSNTNSNGGDLGIAAAVRASLPSLLCDRRFGRHDTPIADTAAATCAVSSVDVWTVDNAAAASVVYDQLRIHTGRVVERDWLDHNITALEAGLMHTIDFRKGCFVGQEAVSKALASARRNADGSAATVRRRIARLRVSSSTSISSSVAVTVGDEVVDEDGDVVGVVLSVADGASLSSALRPMAQYRVQRGDSTTVEIVDTLPASMSAGPGLLGTQGTADADSCLALLKTSYVVVDDSTHPPGQLRIRPRGGDSLLYAAVAEVTGAPYPTYNTAYSPAPPVEKVMPAGKC